MTNPKIEKVILGKRAKAAISGCEDIVEEFLTRSDSIDLVKQVLTKNKNALKEIAATLRDTGFTDGIKVATLRFFGKGDRSADVLCVFKSKALGKDLAALVATLPESVKSQLVTYELVMVTKPREDAEKVLERMAEGLDPTLVAQFRAHLAPEIHVKPSPKATL